MKKTISTILKVNFLRNMLLVSIVCIFIFPLSTMFFIQPKIRQLDLQNTENEALKFARHLADTELPDFGRLTKEVTPLTFTKEFGFHLRDFDIYKIKIFDEQGFTVFSTDENDVGEKAQHEYFYTVVAKGSQHTQVVPQKIITDDDQEDLIDVVETYVPIMRNGSFIGAFEIYYDVTDRLSILNNLLINNMILIFIMTCLFTTIILGTIARAGSEVLKRDTAADALKAGEKKLEKAQKIAHLGNWEWDIHTGELFWSHEIFRIFGYESHEFEPTYEKFLHHIHPEDRQNVEKSLQTALTENIPYNIDHRILRLDGVERTVNEQGEAIFDHQGTPISMTGTILDISERKKFERELAGYRDHLEDLVKKRTNELKTLNDKLQKEIEDRKSAEMNIRNKESRIRALVDTAADGIITIDEHGNIETMNKAVEQIFGYSKSELENKNVSILMSPPHKEKHNQYIENYLRTGKRRILGEVREEVANRKNGQTFPIELATSEFMVGDVIMFAGFIRDITRRKKAEAALEKAKIEAENASHIKDEFLANMSHEIRTPMNAILGFLSIVIDDPALPEKPHHQLSLAHNAAKSLAGLINNILDLSKLESGSFQLKEHDYDFIQMIQEIAESFKMKAREKGVEMNVNIDPQTERFVNGDPLRVKQIIVNLAGNAIKFTQQGKVSIHIQPSEDKKFLEFAIKDTGIGIPTDKIKDIFHLFTQADSTTSRRFGGTGLGTTISKQLVELMGGRIWAESQEGVGSTFYFTVPLKKVEQPMQEFSSKPSIDKKQRNFRILLAEDIEENIALATIRLEQKGHTVVVAQNGHEAVELFKKEHIDIILMDVQMPEKNGIVATREIRQLETHSGNRIPIIALTASVTKEDKELIVNAGMDAIVSKPIDFNLLFGTMQKLVLGNISQVAAAPLATRQEYPISELPALVGVDLKKGLNIWQNSESYLKALVNFANDYRDVVQQVSHVIDEENFDEIIRISHALKGVAGNLAIFEVATIAENMNIAAAGQDKATLARELKTLTRAIDQFLASIRHLSISGSIHDIHARQTIDLHVVKNLCTNLLKACEEYDPDKVEPYLQELQEYFSDEELQLISHAVDELDFESVIRETINFAKQLNITLKG